MRLQKKDFNVFRAGYAEQLEQGFRPRKGINPVRLELPLDWDMDPFQDRNWRFQLHAWRMLQPIWSEFYARDWARLKQELLPWIRDWYGYHVRRRKKSAFMWYDMATGLRAEHLALLINLQQQGLIALDGEEAGEIEELAALHIEMLRNPAFISKGNHGIFQLVGLRLLGTVWAGRPEVEGEEAYSSEQMRRLVESQFGPQGVHVENSPAYHNFAITHFSRIRPELFPSITELFNRILGQAREVAPWFTLPDGSVAAIGDSEGLGEPFTGACLADAELSNRWGDRVLMRDLSKGGYVTVRTDVDVAPNRAEMLIVKGQATRVSHAHADHLGFELHAHGRPLLIDSGKYRYDRSPWREYFTSDRAHNVVGLRDIAFGPEDTDLGKSGLSAAGCSGGEYFIEGRVLRGTGFSHRRRFAYRPGDVLVLRDEIDAPDGEVPVVYLHLAEHAEAEACAEGLAIVVDGHSVATLTYSTACFSAQLVRGQQQPRIQGWRSPAYGQCVPATAIELVGTADLRSWEIAIRLHEPRPDDLLQHPLPGGVAVPFAYSCRTDRVLSRPSGEAERRVILEYFNGPPDRIGQLLLDQLAKAGYTREQSKPEQGGVRAFYRAASGARINVVIRPPATFPVRSVGAAGSVYMAFIEPQEQGRA